MESRELAKRYTTRLGGNGKNKICACIDANDNDLSVVDGKVIGEPIEKLSMFEDAEQMEILFILPCKVGDTIFVIPSKVNYDLNIVNKHVGNNRVYEQKIHSIQMFNSCTYLLKTCEGLSCVRSESYKETWFLSKEEAEKALAELEEKARYLFENNWVT